MLAPDLTQLKRLATIWPEAVRSAEGFSAAAMRGVPSPRHPPVKLPIDIDGLAARPHVQDDSELDGGGVARAGGARPTRRGAPADAYPSGVLSG